MKKKILITGISGFIGRAVLNKLLLLDVFEITALVRPETKRSRIRSFTDKIGIDFIEFGDVDAIRQYLSGKEYDIIIHIGSLRGGRKANHELFYASNVKSTEQFVEYCLDNGKKLLFCSSVGVFGAIPEELPANNESPYKNDNFYHYTKIVCEKIINKAIMKGLDAVVLRPSICYGVNDEGFPQQLVKLVKYRLFPVSNKNIWIHMCHIDTISTAFVRLVTTKNILTGHFFNIADMEPVRLKDLVNFIYRQIYNKNYPKILNVDNGLLLLGEKISRQIRSELWTSRFELISRSWFYQVQDSYQLLDLPTHYTLPDFKIVVSPDSHSND